jgi:fatty-acyl-CoA synthase
MPVHLTTLDPFAFLERSAVIYREKVAVIDGDRRYTYVELFDRVRRLAATLQAAGIRDGARVAVLSPNARMPSKRPLPCRSRAGSYAR